MESLVIVLFLIICICQIFMLRLLASISSKQGNKNIDTKILDSCSNRTQRRNMEKQLSIFKEKFSKFNNFQLNAIRDLIDKIQEDRL